MEQWKAIKGYEGLYEVSNTGKVRSLNYRHACKVKELSPGKNSYRGYLCVCLWKDGKSKTFLIHRIVVETFISEIPKGLVVNHKDENKHNNNVENLEICTYSYNNNYGTRNERASAALKGKKLSQEHRANVSAALKGNTPWNKGKKLSPETRAKISATLKGNKNACRH